MRILKNLHSITFIILCSSLSVIAQAILNKAIDNLPQIRDENRIYALKSYHQNPITSVHHHYFVQLINGIEVFESITGVHLSADGKLIKLDKPRYADFIHQENGAILNRSQILEKGSIQLKAFIEGQHQSHRSINLNRHLLGRNDADLNSKQISDKLIYYPSQNRELRLSYQLDINEKESDYLTVILDAQTGELLDIRNHAFYEEFITPSSSEIISSKAATGREIKNVNQMSAGYKVFELPLPHPLNGDRTLVTNPALPTASPLGWHSTLPGLIPEYTITRGNNVYAFKNENGNQYSPDGGSTLVFDHLLDTTYSVGSPSKDAAITNVFYLINRIHDILYTYGFDEAAGNFQTNNFGNGGAGNDAVVALVQDNTETCNASMSFPVDGMAPNMTVYVCNDHDVAYDGPVIIHEYAHGLTGRLIGGPQESNCIQPRNGGNEGWSDIFGLLLTIEPGDLGSDVKSHGEWYKTNTVSPSFGRRYSTDSILAYEGATYKFYESFADIADGYRSIHSVGIVWASIYWDVTWALIDQYGLNPNIDQPWNTGGNNLAIQLAVDALKLLPCNANFIDNRDAVLAADMALTGGQNQCVLWQAFAKRGLGINATQTYINDVLTASNSFEIPEVFQIQKTVSQNTASVGQTLQYSIELINTAICGDTLYNVVVSDTLDSRLLYAVGSASNGGSINGNIISWNIAQINPGTILALTYEASIQTNIPDNIFLIEDFETGSTGFIPGLWETNNSSFSGSTSMFAQNPAFSTTKALLLDPFTPSANTVLSFWHKYDTEPTWDGGRVQVSRNNGQSWTDLGPHFILNGYSSVLLDESLGQKVAAFSGTIANYIESKIDLSSFAGNDVIIRFLMTSDNIIGGNGWFVDLVSIYNEGIFNEANARSNGQAYVVKSNKVHTSVQEPCYGLKVLSNGDTGAASLRDIIGCAVGGDTIDFAPHLSSIVLINEILLDKNLIILGHNSLNINGSLSNARLFSIANGANVAFNNIQFVQGGGPGFVGNGGAFHQTGIGSQSYFKQCSFTFNQAEIGGVMYVQSGSSNFVNCTFSENASINTGSLIALDTGSSVQFDQSVIHSNYGIGNAMMINNGGNLQIRNSTMSRNSHLHTIQNSGDVSLYNTIFKNTQGDVLSSSSGTILSSNNLIDLPGDLPTGLNITGDPMFVDELGNNFHLTNLSPAINNGNEAFLPLDVYDFDNDLNTTEFLPFDAEGNVRIYSCGLDIGAYEFQRNTAPVHVRNTNDNGLGSLRFSLACAPAGSTIVFDTDTNADTIFLTSGALVVDKELTILGNAKDSTIISGSMNVPDRIIYCNNAQVEIQNVSILNGGGAGFMSPGAGLAALNGSQVKLNKVKFAGNSTAQAGGGLFIDGMSNLLAYNVELSANKALQASAICNLGTAVLRQTLIANNASTGLSDPSTIRNVGTSEIIQSTIADNQNLFACLHNASGASLLIQNTLMSDTTSVVLKNSGTVSSMNNLIDDISDEGDFQFLNHIKSPATLKYSGDHPYSIGFGSEAVAGGNIGNIPTDVFDEDGDSDVMEPILFDIRGVQRLGPCGVSFGAYEYVEPDFFIPVRSAVDGATGSLRAVIACAPAGATIDLSNHYHTLSMGELELNKDLNFMGQPVSFSWIDGNNDTDNDSRLFHVTNASKVSFENVILYKGGGLNFAGPGSAIFVESGSEVRLKKVKISENRTTNGIISVETGAKLTAFNSVMNDNLATETIIEGTGNIQLNQCLVNNNSASSLNSNVFKINFPGRLDIKQSTIASNAATNATLNNLGAVNVSNTIFDNMVGFEHAGGGALVSNYNLIKDESKAGPLQYVGVGSKIGNPHFDLFNGFGENKYVLLPISKAINAGGVSEIPLDSCDVDGDLDLNEALPTDFANNPRIALCGMVDIGAFEHQTQNINWVVNNVNDGQLGSFRSIIGCALDGDSIMFDPITDFSSQDLTLGEIVLNKNLIVTGNGPQDTRLNGFNVGAEERLFSLNAPGKIIFKDLRISGGGGSNYTGNGAGLLVSGGEAVFINCAFSNHQNNDKGGVFFVQTGSSLELLNCNLFDNYANEGAIVWNEGLTSITQNIIHSNTSTLSGLVTNGLNKILVINQSTSYGNNVFGDFVSVLDEATFISTNSVYSKNAQRELFLSPGSNYIGNNNLIDTSRNQGGFLTGIYDFLDLPAFDLNPYPNFALQQNDVGQGMGDFSNLPFDDYDLDHDNNTFEKLPLDFAGNPRIYGCNQLDIGAYEGLSGPTGLFVRNVNDSGANSLRDVIACAPAGSAIRFWKAYNGNPINLTSGPIVIDKDLFLVGNGVQNTLIDVSNNTIPTALILSQNIDLFIHGIKLNKQ